MGSRGLPHGPLAAPVEESSAGPICEKFASVGRVGLSQREHSAHRSKYMHVTHRIGQFEFATYGGPPLSAKNRRMVEFHMLSLAFKAPTILSILSSMQVVIAARVRRAVLLIHAYCSM
jgi:hypothetical protein